MSTEDLRNEARFDRVSVPMLIATVKIRGGKNVLRRCSSKWKCGPNFWDNDVAGDQPRQISAKHDTLHFMARKHHTLPMV